jgi:hypothetical protein
MPTNLRCSVRSRVRERRWARGLLVVLVLFPALVLSLASAAVAASTGSPRAPHSTVARTTVSLKAARVSTAPVVSLSPKSLAFPAAGGGP